MKLCFVIVSFLLLGKIQSQTDLLISGVYSYTKATTQTTKTGERKDILKGSTLDLSSFQIHTSMLLPGITNHPPAAYSNKEELVIVKEGKLTVTINDSTKTLSAGSITLIEAGDKQSFSNNSNEKTIYYIITFIGRSPVDIVRGKQNGGSVMKDWNELPVTTTTKGESRQVFDKPTSMFSRLSIHVTNLNPTVASHAPHVHRAEEIMLLLKGDGTLQSEQNMIIAEQGDIMFLQSNKLHAFKNGDKEMCSYYAIQWFL